MIRRPRVTKFVGLTLAALLAMAPAAMASSSGGHGDAPAATQKSVSETIKAAVAGNDEFRSHHGSAYFEAYQKGQVPNLTVITCADSRVHTPLFGMDPHNNIFIIRNVGNQIVNSEGSVDYGVRHLPTKVLLVMGHSSCGAVKAAMGDYSGETTGIKAELDTLKPVLDAADSGQGPFKVRWDRNVEANVDHQVEYAMQLYADKINSGKMAVIGAVYDFNANYGRDRGLLVITNVNGEKNPNKIIQDKHHILGDLSDAEIINHVGSLAP